MKLKVFTFLLMAATTVHGQWIKSINVIPPNPTINDNIMIVADMDFTSGSCDEATSGHVINGNTIQAFTLHCTGMLTFICNDLDTFLIGNLPAGNYSFQLQVDEGSLPSPCTPGINPGPSSTINFTVSGASGLPSMPDQKSDMYYQYSSNSLIFKNNKLTDGYLELINMNGQMIMKTQLNRVSIVALPKLSSGIYMAKLIDSNGNIITNKFTINDL
jgi:hypothetical protein